MRITLCVDALQPQLSGIGRYTWELCKGLARREEISSLRFYRGGSLIEDAARLLIDADHRAKRSRLRRRLDRWQTRNALRSTLVHGPNYFLPAETETGVITVHDLSVYRFPETHPANRVKAFEQLFASSLSRAAHVITDTKTVRDELINTFSVAPDTVSAIALGVDERFRTVGSRQVRGVIARWGLTSGSYGLSVAAFEPRKKIAELIAAWGRLPDVLRFRYPLVLAGAEGWRNGPLHEQIWKAASEGWLKYLGYVDDALLPALYAGARNFVYPSIYEGFGLPPIEAMASGVPVLVSNRSCLPEVCGDAARFFDPDDPDAFTSAIEESLSDEQWRTQTILRGLAHARRFTWDSCVTDTVAIYRKALM